MLRPTKKGTSKINQYTTLQEEATYINNVFKEQMVFHAMEYRQKFKKPHPFEKELGGKNQQKNNNKKGRNRNKNNNANRNKNQEVASQAFSYNLFDITDNIKVICRCGIDGFIVDQNSRNQRNKDWVKVYALNQYDSNRSKTQNWLKYLDTRDSTILSQVFSIQIRG